MKKTLCLLLALLLLALAGCGGGKAPAAPANADLHPEDEQQGRPGFRETADGIYSRWTNESSRSLVELIYFCPAGEETFYPLCSKPNCLHTDGNCNAYIGAGASFGFYKDHIYTAAFNISKQGFDIIRMNPDGTDRSAVTNVPFPVEASACQVKFHRGNAYMEISPDAAMPLEEQIPHLVVVNLDTLEQTEPFAELFTTGGVYVYEIACFDGDKSYATGLFRGGSRGDDAMIPIIELDIAAGTYRTVFELPSTPWVENNTCYYEEVGKGFRQRDLTTGEIKEIDFPSGDGRSAYYDTDYIYLTGEGEQEKTLYILTRDYELVDQITLANGEWLHNVSAQRLLFARLNNTIPPYCAYLDKSQIGSGKLELQPITVNG